MDGQRFKALHDSLHDLSLWLGNGHWPARVERLQRARSASSRSETAVAQLALQFKSFAPIERHVWNAP